MKWLSYLAGTIGLSEMYDGIFEPLGGISAPQEKSHFAAAFSKRLFFDHVPPEATKTSPAAHKEGLNATEHYEAPAYKPMVRV